MDGFAYMDKTDSGVGSAFNILPSGFILLADHMLGFEMPRHPGDPPADISGIWIPNAQEAALLAMFGINPLMIPARVASMSDEDVLAHFNNLFNDAFNLRYRNEGLALNSVIRDHPELLYRHILATTRMNLSESDLIVLELIERSLTSLAPTPYEALRMASHVYGFRINDDNRYGYVLPGGWRLYGNPIHIGIDGLMSIYVREGIDGTRAYTIANRGTQLTNFDNWFANYLQLFGGSPDKLDSLREAQNFVNSRPDGTSITFTGHSKGGGEANANAILTGRDSITFNTAPSSFLGPQGTALGNSTANSMTNFVVGGDILNQVFGNSSMPNSQTVILPSQVPTTSSVSQHIFPPLTLYNFVAGFPNHPRDPIFPSMKDAGYGFHLQEGHPILLPLERGR